MRGWFVRLWPVVFVLGIVACDGGEHHPPSLSGVWSAETRALWTSETGDSLQVPVHLTFFVTEGRGEVQGQFVRQVVTPGGPSSTEEVFAVDGVYDFPVVVLSVHAKDQHSPVVFRGQMAEHGQAMRLSGPLRNEQDLFFRRQ